MFKVFDIAGSAMSAQTLRLNVTASNLANANSVSSSLDQTYRAREPVFATALDEAISEGAAVGGVSVQAVVESQAPLQRRYEPGHPMADQQGFIYLPNVNVIEEMANMIAASRSYESSVEVVNTAKQLMLKALTLGQ